ncbi:MAG TPA: nuclear transport factor 2 family protein [Anaerolineales bacterium]|nr:nuclear transport factor 2 family protein [Anaerolineales bacterium]
MESNKDMAVAFLELASNGEIREAYSKFIGRGFKHHNPFYEGSAESLAAGMEENARQNPNKMFEVKRAIAEGDYVVVHSYVRQRPDDRGAAVVHIFRFENRRIVELWDLGQPVPESSPNQYGIF